MTELIPYFIQEKLKSKQNTGSLEAYTMFIDIVGFTSLTARHLQKGNVGAEELSLILNNIFEPLVDTVYENGGFIPYYAGDAFLAIFPFNDENTSEKFIQTAMLVLNNFEKRKDEVEQTEIKIGISSGKLEWGIVGKSKRSYFFNGFPILKCVYAQSLALGGEIISDKKLLPPDQKFPVEELDEVGFVKLEKFTADKNKGFQKHIPKSNDFAHLDFLPKKITDPELQGEIRSVVSTFIAFEGVNKFEELNEFSSLVLELTQNFSGYFKEIDFSDKGGVIVIFFGAPVSYENNIERSLEFILLMSKRIQELAIKDQLHFKAGITHGPCFTGMIGGKMKKQYAALGNKVNVAARLMSSGEWGEILVDEEIQKSKQFLFKEKGSIKYKGLQNKIATYALEGKKEGEELFEGEFFGRVKEKKIISSFIRDRINGVKGSGVITVYGEAGSGKSRLLQEALINNSMIGKSQWIICQADQILRKPFNPIIYFLRTFFRQNNSSNSKKKNFKIYERKFAEVLEDSDDINISKELVRTKSILAGLLGYKIKGGLWQELDAKGRFNNSISAVSNLFIALAQQETLVIEMEDAHWFDASTISFIQKFIYQISSYSIVLLFTSRYLDNGSKPKFLTAEMLDDAGIQFKEIDLNLLDNEALLNYTKSKLKGEISAEFELLLQRTTHGNPFYLGQMLEYFTESKLLVKVDNVWDIKDKSIKLSNSMNSILIARVDRLSELVKETVKAAAVIGREFDLPVLAEVMKSNEAFQNEMGSTKTILDDQVKNAEKVQIWNAINELKYIFKHSLLRETVYDMQLGSRLKELHGLIGNAIEILYSKEIESKYFELAFHFDQAEIRKKALQYAKKAADVCRKNFQNDLSLHYYEKALTYINKDRKAEAYSKILLRQAEILEFIGEWDKSILALKEAIIILENKDSESLLARTRNQLGKVYNLKGEYDNSYIEIEKAMDIFASLDDNIGLFKTYGNMGDLKFRLGAYDDAKEYFLKSIALAKAFKKSFTVTQIVSNLGLTYMNQSDYEKGIACQVEQLEYCIQGGDRNGMAILNTNLGIVYAEKGDAIQAMEYFEKGLALSEELGNKQMKAIAIGSIGALQEASGEYDKAYKNFELDLRLCKELGDKRGLSIVHGLLGDLLIAKGEFVDAKFHLQEQLKLSKKLNYQKGITKALISQAELNKYLNKSMDAESDLLEAAQISKEIQYIPSLEESYVKLTELYIDKNKIKEAINVLIQLKNIDNNEQDFETKLLEGNIALANKDSSKAKEIFLGLKEKNLSKTENAKLYYSLSKMDSSYLEKAKEITKTVYAKTPHYGIKQKLDVLENSK